MALYRLTPRARMCAPSRVTPARIGLARTMILAMLLFASPARALIGGVVDANTPDSPWAGVGSLTLSGGGTFSGTLIGPRHVLTAAHVVNGLRDAPEHINFHLNIGGSLTHSFAAAAVHVYPGYRGTQAGPDGVWHNDLAIVELAQDVPPFVPIYPLYAEPPGHTPDSRALTLVSYGTGADPKRNDLIPGQPDVKRVGQNRLDLLIPNRQLGRPEVFVFGLPSPQSDVLLDGHGDSFERLGGTPEASYIGGDSGSPVFVRNRGTWQLAGIATFAGHTRGAGGPSFAEAAIGGGTLVAAHLHWLQDQISRPPTRPGSTAARLGSIAALILPAIILIGYAIRRGLGRAPSPGRSTLKSIARPPQD